MSLSDFADIGSISQQIEQGADAEARGASFSILRGRAARPDPCRVKESSEFRDGAKTQIFGKHPFYPHRLVRLDNKLLVAGAIAERRLSSRLIASVTRRFRPAMNTRNGCESGALPPR
jgi:hypothetical protein